MLRIILSLFCLNVILLQDIHAQETMKDYLGLSKNELEEIKKIERIYAGKDILVPSLIGDQSEWTKVNAREIPSYYCSDIADWVATVLNQSVIVRDKNENFNDGIAGWRHYFGHTIAPNIKNPKGYQAGISMLTWQHEKDGNKFLVIQGRDTIDLWINLNEQHSKQKLDKKNIERFSKDVLASFFSLSKNSIESLQCKENDDKGTFQCCDLQVTFDMNSRPKVKFNDQEYPKALTWSEQFKMMTNGKVVRVSLPRIKNQDARPEGVGFQQQPLDQQEPGF